MASYIAASMAHNIKAQNMQHDAPHTLFFKQTTTTKYNILKLKILKNTAAAAVHFIFMRPTIIKFKAAGDKVNTTINN